MLFNIFFGLLLLILSLLIARFVEQRWEKATILVLGLVTAGIIMLSPLICDFLRASQAPSDTEILHALYGADTAIQERLDGKTIYIIEELSGAEKEQFSYASQVHTRVVYKMSGWDQNPQKYIVLTRTGPPTCCDRSQLPVLGGALFSQETGNWQVGSAQKRLTPYADFEHIETGEIKTIGPQKTVLVLHETQLLDGVTRTSDLLIAEFDARLAVIATIETGASNAENCPPMAALAPCWSASAVYEFIPGENPAYHDIVIKTSGTRIVAGELVAFEEITKLVFAAGRYQVLDEG